MTTDSVQHSESAQKSAPEAEVLRLRQQLAAREEVISQLNRRIIEVPVGTSDAGESESDQDALADAVVHGRELNAELQRLRDVVAQQQSEIVALRHQLGVYDRLGMSTAVGGAQKVWGLVRRVGGRT
jgi:hypothetical protein